MNINRSIIKINTSTTKVVKPFRLKSLLFFTVLTLSSLFITSNVLGQCSNITNAGSIGGDQTGCGAFNPTTIYSIAAPSGGSGTMEIIWIKKTLGGSWSSIPGENGLSYDPGVITETTIFRRCSRRTGCNSFVGESNNILITVNPTFTTSSSASATSCSPDSMKVCNLSDYNGSRTIWLPNLSGCPGTARFSLINNSGKLYQFNDGTAHLVALAQKTNNPNKQWAVSLWFKDKKDWTAWSAGGKGYKNGGGLTNAHQNWDYYVMDNSKQNTLTGLLDLSGVELDLSLMGNTYGFQVGDGANDQDTDFGISFWFTYTSSTPNFSGYGDFNMDASCGNALDRGATASVSVTGSSSPYVYSWSNGLYGNEAKGLSAGSYDVTVTDANGCSVVENIIVNNPPCCNVTNPGLINADQSGCAPFDPSLLTNLMPASGGLGAPEYLWITNTILEPVSATSGWTAIAGANGSSYDPGALTQTTYFIRCARNSGCSNYIAESNIITITINANPTVIASSTNTLCNGNADGTATVSVTGGTAPYAYLWSNGAATATISGLNAGTYSIIVTDANGCSSNSDTAIVNEPTLLTVATTTNDAACFNGNDGTAMAIANGGTAPYSYLWSNGGNTATISGLTAGTYSVVITDANGCSSNSDTAIVNEPTLLTAATTANDAACFNGNDGTAMATTNGGTAPYSYLWSNGGNTATISGLTAGAYSVVVTDANGCSSSSDTAIVNEPTLLTATTTATDVACFGGNDGTATATANGGTTPYSYLWSNGDITATISGLNAGTYSVVVTDANGCSTNISATVNEPNQLTATDSSTSVACNGGNDGTATVSLTGGTTPYTYLWNTSATSATISGLNAGTYSVVVTDDNGCSTNASTTVSEPIHLTATASATDVSCFGGNDGTATVTANGGTAPYAYLWSNGATSATIYGLNAGIYSTVITDANGCSASALTTVNEPTAVISTVSSTVVCREVQGTATVNPSGGSGTYSYLWSNGEATATITDLNAGAYSVTVTDANLCINTNSVAVTQSPNLFVYAKSTATACSSTSAGFVIGGVPGYSYSWTQSGNEVSTNNPALGLPPGLTSLTITDANGCTAKAKNIFVTAPIPIIVSITLNQNSAIATPQNGATPYTYLWDDPNGTTTNTLSGVQGYYTVTVTDANGCIATESVTISAQQSQALVLNAYPNPFVGEVTLTLKSSYDTQADVSIYSTDGSIVEDVYSGEIVKDEPYMFKINQDGRLRSGVYIYKIVTPEGVQHHRIIAN